MEVFRCSQEQWNIQEKRVPVVPTCYFGRGCRGVGVLILLGPPSNVLPSGAPVSVVDVGHSPKRLIILDRTPYMGSRYNACLNVTLLTFAHHLDFSLSPLVIIIIVILAVFSHFIPSVTGLN